MAGPLAGLGAGQQIPISTPFQSGQNGNNEQIRPNRENEDQTPRPNTVQAQNAPAASTQSAENTNNRQDTLNDIQERALAAAESSEPQERGSIVDISV